MHILDWKDDYLALPVVAGVASAHLFATGAKLELRKLDGGMLLRLSAEARDPIDTIVVLQAK